MGASGSKFADDDMIVFARAGVGPAKPELTAGIRREQSLSITTRIEYAAIPQGRAQDVFGIVTLQASDNVVAAQKMEEKRQPLDIVCVLDVSGSMSGEKLSLVQDAVRFVIRESQPHDRLSMVSFNSQAARVLRLCRMRDEGKDEALVATRNLTAGGGTRIASGLETALQVIEQRRRRNPVSAILLLTDGQDPSASGDLPPLVARAQSAGCSLYAFGFGVGHDARVLASVAEQAQTPFTFVEDVDQIGAAFAGAVGGLASVAAQRVEVSLNCSVALKAVHTPFPVTRQGNRTSIQIPDMLAGERRDVLVEVSVPVDVGGANNTVLMTASANYWDLVAGAAAQTSSAEMCLARTPSNEPAPELEPDEQVAAQRNRVEVAQTLQTATALGEAGQFQQAQALLRAHEGRLQSAKRKTTVSEALALDLQDAHSRMESRASWEDGGMAEMRDSTQMHTMQRTTNMSSSSKSCQKKSKGMYATSTQLSWISKLG